MCKLRNAPPRNERNHRAFLLGSHPHEVSSIAELRALQAVAQDHQKPNLGQVFLGKGMNVHREVGDDARRLEGGLQPFLEVAGLVRLVPDQNQGVRPRIRSARLPSLKRCRGDRQLAINVHDVLGQWEVVRHPHEAVGR